MTKDCEPFLMVKVFRLLAESSRKQLPGIDFERSMALTHFSKQARKQRTIPKIRAIRLVV